LAGVPVNDILTVSLREKYFLCLNEKQLKFSEELQTLFFKEKLHKLNPLLRDSMVQLKFDFNLCAQHIRQSILIEKIHKLGN